MTVSHSGAVCILRAGSERVCLCAEEVGEGSLCSLKGKHKAHKAGRAGRQAAGKASEESAELADAPTNKPLDFTSPRLAPLPPPLPHSRAEAEPRYGKAAFRSLDPADKKKKARKKAESCRGRADGELGTGLQLGAARREDGSTKAACVLQLGLCASLC